VVLKLKRALGNKKLDQTKDLNFDNLFLILIIDFLYIFETFKFDLNLIKKT